MAWARRSGAIRRFGWLVPTLLALVHPSAFGQQAAGSSRVQAETRRVVISVADRRLAVVEDGAVLRVFPVAVGAAGSPSPAGTYEVTKRLERPTYYHPGQVIPPGKNNPLGPRWIGLNVKGYGIHGTNIPSSVGKAASHGCIRLRNRDIMQLFAMVKVGDIVEIHGERDETVVALFGSEPHMGAGGEVQLAQQTTGPGVAGAQ